MKLENNDMDLSIVLYCIAFYFIHVCSTRRHALTASFGPFHFHFPLAIVRRDEKVIARAISTLRQFRGHRIPRGTYVIPFEFALPSSLPSSTQFPKVDSRAFNGRIKVSQCIFLFLQVIVSSD
jgi:hypothetical protein